MTHHRFRCTRHAVLNALLDILQEQRYAVVHLDDRRGEVRAVRGMPALGLGRRLIVEMEEVGGVTQVSIQCRSAIPVLSLGRNEQSEQEVLKGLLRDL